MVGKKLGSGGVAKDSRGGGSSRKEKKRSVQDTRKTTKKF